MKIRLPLIIGLCCFAVGIVLYGWQESRATGGQVGFPLDDSWIHLQFARNVATGWGFSYNPGEPTPGSTAPLWTLLLAANGAVGLPLPLSAKLWGVLLGAAREDRVPRRAVRPRRLARARRRSRRSSPGCPTRRNADRSENRARRGKTMGKRSSRRPAMKSRRAPASDCR